MVFLELHGDFQRPYFSFHGKAVDIHAEELKQKQMFVLGDVSVLLNLIVCSSWFFDTRSTYSQQNDHISEFLEKSHELQILVMFVSMLVVH